MGAVYEVEETSVEAPFVMKVVHPELLRPGSHAAERMRQEAKTQARLDHKNIVRVYRAGVTAESPPLPFYVMDRLSGYTVRHVLHWHRSKGMLVPLSWVFWISANLLQALEHAHKNGVIHRDVKPDNIFIHHADGQRPIAKLLDFGIMAAVSELADKTRLTAGGFAGTYTHAAPEQLQGAPPAPAMDIYAAGMVLYQLLAGRHPFEDRKTPEAIIQAHVLETPPPISERPGLHPKLQRLVLQMLAKDPKQRPGSAQEALNELARIKTEWMQQSSDGSDVIDFQFDADIGERWPTNVNGNDDFSLGSATSGEGVRRPSRQPASAALLGEPELGNIRPLELPSTHDGKISVPTRTGWGRTFVASAPIRATHVLFAALGFALLTVVVAWYWMHANRDSRIPGESPASSAAAAIATPSLSVTAPAAVTITAPAREDPAGGGTIEHSAPVYAAGQTPPVPPSSRVPAKRSPSLAKTVGPRQSPPAEPLTRPKSPGGAEDPMEP